MKFKNLLIEKLGEIKYRIIAVGLPVLIYIIFLLTITTSKYYFNINIDNFRHTIMIIMLIDVVWLISGMGLILYVDIMRHKIIKKFVEKYKNEN